MDNHNGGKTESTEKNGIAGGVRPGSSSASSSAGRPKISFDYEYSKADLAVGKRAKASAEEPKQEAKPAEKPAENVKKSLKGTKKTVPETDQKQRKPKRKKAEKAGKSGKTAKEDPKPPKKPAKHGRGIEEDGLDTSSVAVARGISHEARRRKQNIHDLIRLGVAVLIIAAIVGGGLLAFRWTTVKTINVTGSEKYSAAQLLNMSRIRAGRNILFYNEKKLAEDMNAIPDIRIVSVKKKLPNHVDIVVSDIVPCAAIEAPDGSYSYVAEDGYVLSTGEKESGGLIVVRGMTGEGITPGTYLDKQSPTLRTTYFVKLMQAVRESAVADSVRGIDVSSSVYVTLTLDGDYTIVLGSLTTADACVETAAKAYQKFLPVYPNGGTINVFYGKTQVDFTPNK